jgi:hypothetical protein
MPETPAMPRWNQIEKLGKNWTLQNQIKARPDERINIYINRNLGYTVALSIDDIGPHTWLHVSLTRSDSQMPSYRDLKNLKDTFIGPDLTAVQIFPPADQHVNAHETCLHLWACLDAEILPDPIVRKP